jgi:hypothetical protein
MRFNSSIIGPKQSVSISVANGIFSLAEQQQLQGASSWPVVASPALYSIFFDGNGDYLSVPASTSLSLDADFTIECWIYLTSAPADYQMIISSSDGNNYLSIRSTQIEVVGLSAPVQISFSGLLTANLWHNLAITRSGSTVTAWLDGKSLGTSASKTGTLSLGSASLSTYIGRWGSTPQYNFPGYISNLRVTKGQSLYSATYALPTINYAVTANTSLLLGTSNSLTDASTYNHAITATGQVAASTTYGPNIAASISLNGTTDYLALNAGSPLSLTDDFTVEFFARFSSLTSYRTPLTLASGSGGGENYLQSTTSGGTSFTWGGWANTNLSGGTGFSTDTWYHLALCRSGSTIRSFKDGSLIASGTGSGTIPSSGGYLYIGSQNSTQWFFSGFISNLRILKGSAIYTTAFTPPTSNLTNIANTALLMGQYQAFALDFSNNAIASSKGGSTTYSTTVLPF